MKLQGEAAGRVNGAEQHQQPEGNLMYVCDNSSLPVEEIMKERRQGHTVRAYGVWRGKGMLRCLPRLPLLLEVWQLLIPSL